LHNLEIIADFRKHRPSYSKGRKYDYTVNVYGKDKGHYTH